MSEGDRGHYFAAALTAIGLLSAAYYTMPREVSVRETYSEEDCAEKTYSMRGMPDGGFEFRVTRDEEACEHQAAAYQNADNAPHSPRTIAEADLLAQQQMAHWTTWIGVFTAVSLAVLYTTFHATRQAVVETREIGQKQTRAYISGTSARYIESPKQPLAIELTLRNTGQSPAKGVMFTPRYVLTVLDNIPPKTKNATVLEVKGWPSFPQTIAAQTELQVEIKLDAFDASKHVPYSGEILDVSVQADIMFSDVFGELQWATVDINEAKDAVAVGLPRQVASEPVPLRIKTSEGRRSQPDQEKAS